MAASKELARREGNGLSAAWRPFREIEREFKDLMSATLEDFFGAGLQPTVDLIGGRAWAPAVDVQQSDKEYTFEVELPGLEKDDFKAEMQDGMLLISGERKERKEEKGKNYVRHEQFYGQFRRAFSMPVDADAAGVKAAYRNGILTVTVPRSEKAKPKSIPINIA